MKVAFYIDGSFMNYNEPLKLTTEWELPFLPRKGEYMEGIDKLFKGKLPEVILGQRWYVMHVDWEWHEETNFLIPEIYIQHVEADR
ncbi:hypothetical protein AHMF7605_11765 [Adhaeribacter arboris]|uniref:Uncharacterized protein n=1 Tax=Adhaeribacter arboris TaxID=2072846 RepID=A0A2T2YFB1_9BACT|nr:hypothetical protein [Adhaeribacter arboris]PSR54148.1 hypothetical protein AHMF7605_11765 [Adhaeribacter arboris]